VPQALSITIHFSQNYNGLCAYKIGKLVILSGVVRCSASSGVNAGTKIFTISGTGLGLPVHQFNGVFVAENGTAGSCRTDGSNSNDIYCGNNVPYNSYTSFSLVYVVN